MKTVLAWIGGVWLFLAAAFCIAYGYAFINYIWFWRFGKGKKALP